MNKYKILLIIIVILLILYSLVGPSCNRDGSGNYVEDKRTLSLRHIYKF